MAHIDCDRRTLKRRSHGLEHMDRRHDSCFTYLGDCCKCNLHNHAGNDLLRGTIDLRGNKRKVRLSNRIPKDEPGSQLEWYQGKVIRLIPIAALRRILRSTSSSG